MVWRRHRHIKKNIKSTTNLTRAHIINQPTFCLLPNCAQEQNHLRKQTSGKEKPEKRERKWTGSEWRDTGSENQEASKIPVEAGQCLQAAAGSCIPLLNLNQTETDPSWNQCPNQDEPLRRTRCTEKDVGGKVRRRLQHTNNKKTEEDGKISPLAVITVCDASRPAMSSDCARNKNNHSSSWCERKINRAGDETIAHGLQ